MEKKFKCVMLYGIILIVFVQLLSLFLNKIDDENLNMLSNLLLPRLVNFLLNPSVNVTETDTTE